MSILSDRIKSALILMIALINQACAPTAIRNDFSPYLHYQEISNKIKEEKFKDAFSMLSMEINESFKGENPTISIDIFLPYLQSITRVVSKEYGHFEKFEKTRYCLTLYGRNDADRPTSIDFELINEQNQWKFSKIGIAYLISDTEYPTTAKCPSIP